jgi:hypothetical protein
MRRSFSPVSEGHRIALLGWARKLYDKGMSRCYAVVRAMGEDQDAGYPDPVRSRDLDDEYDDAQFERMDAEDVTYGVANADVARAARPDDIDLARRPLPKKWRDVVLRHKGAPGFDAAAAKVAFLYYMATLPKWHPLPIAEVLRARFDGEPRLLTAGFRMLDGQVETYEFREGRFAEWTVWSMLQRNRGTGRLWFDDEKFVRLLPIQGELEFEPLRE